MSYFTASCLYLTTGAIAIAIGGLLTTKGWNEYSNHSARQTLISAGIRELDQNTQYFEDMDEAQAKIAGLQQVYLLPTFHYDGIQAIHLSPLFSKEDRSVLSTAPSFVYNVHPVNDSVRKLNDLFSDTGPPLEHKKKQYVSFYTSPIFQRFRQICMSNFPQSSDKTLASHLAHQYRRKG